MDLRGFTHRPEVSPGYQINEVGAKRDPRLSREKGAMTCSRSDLFFFLFPFLFSLFPFGQTHFEMILCYPIQL